ncbi:hypothetical protein ACTA71_005112 [Dictyostelium dimigraforme]
MKNRESTFKGLWLTEIPFYHFDFKVGEYEPKKRKFDQFANKQDFYRYQQYREMVFNRIKEAVSKYNAKEAESILLHSKYRLNATDRFKNLMMHYAQDITFKQHISLLNNITEVANYKLSSVDPSNRDNYIEQIKSLQQQERSQTNQLQMDREIKIALDYVKEVQSIIEGANSEQPETFVDTAIIEEELEKRDGCVAGQEKEKDKDENEDEDSIYEHEYNNIKEL